MLQKVSKEIDTTGLKEELILEKIPNVLFVEEINYLILNEKKTLVTARIRCHNSNEYNRIQNNIGDFFQKKGFNYGSYTIHLIFDQVLYLLI
jgi:hypothetical protein